MLLKVLAIVLCLLIIGMQKRLQNIDRLTGRDAQTIRWRYITTAGITHRFPLSSFRSGFSRENLVEQLPGFGCLGGSFSGDNVYKVTVAEPQIATPGVEIVRPITGTDLCDTNNDLEAEAVYGTFPELDIPDDEIEWLLDGVSLGYGRRITERLPVGMHVLSVRAYGDGSAGDSMNVNVLDCPGLPPVATITQPGHIDEYATEYDANGYYLDVTLSALAYDQDAGGTVTVEWTTSRGDVQPGGEILATEANATVRLYTSCGIGFGTAEHEIVLTVEDEDGNPAQDRVVVIVRTLC